MPSDSASAQRRSHLPEHLRLARDERVETRGHAVQVQRRRRVGEAVEDGLELARVDADELGQLADAERREVRRVRAPEVELGAVAGGEHDGLARACLGEVLDEAARLGLGEGDASAQADACPVVRETDGDEPHVTVIRSGSATGSERSARRASSATTSPSSRWYFERRIHTYSSTSSHTTA